VADETVKDAALQQLREEQNRECADRLATLAEEEYYPGDSRVEALY